MKSLIRATATVIAISAIAVGTASAMIPTPDLTINIHPDAGAASRLNTDLGNGTAQFPSLNYGAGFDHENGGTATGTQELRDLVGKHFI